MLHHFVTCPFAQISSLYVVPSITLIYPLSLHDALPILVMGTRSGDLDPAIHGHLHRELGWSLDEIDRALYRDSGQARSEEHTSELQSRLHLVCRLLLEKKKSSAACGASGIPATCSTISSLARSPRSRRCTLCLPSH